jgi:NifU-like protein involved in Fe-S cluster formation
VGAISDLKIEALRQRLDALAKDADTANATAVAARRCVQATHLLLEEEHAIAANLERKAVTAKGLLSSSSSSSTTTDMVNGATYDLALVTNLHVQATAVPNVR